MFYYIHNNTNYHGWTFGVGSIQLSFRPLCSPNTCKDFFNPNVTTFQSNCAEGLHFSPFHYNSNNAGLSACNSRVETAGLKEPVF